MVLWSQKLDIQTVLAVQLLIFQTYFSDCIHNIAFRYTQLAVLGLHLAELQQFANQIVQTYGTLVDNSQTMLGFLWDIAVFSQIFQRTYDQR